MGHIETLAECPNVGVTKIHGTWYTVDRAEQAIIGPAHETKLAAISYARHREATTYYK